MGRGPRDTSRTAVRSRDPRSSQCSSGPVHSGSLLPEWPQPPGQPGPKFAPTAPPLRQARWKGTWGSLEPSSQRHVQALLLPLVRELLTSPHRPGQEAASPACSVESRPLSPPWACRAHVAMLMGRQQIPGSGRSGTHPAGHTCPREACSLWEQDGHTASLPLISQDRLPSHVPAPGQRPICKPDGEPAHQHRSCADRDLWSASTLSAAGGRHAPMPGTDGQKISLGGRAVSVPGGAGPCALSAQHCLSPSSHPSLERAEREKWCRRLSLPHTQGPQEEAE